MNSENNEKQEVLQAAEVPSVEVENAEQGVASNSAPQEPAELHRKPRKFPTWVDFFATAGVFVFSVLLGSFLSVVLMKARGVESLTPDITFVYYIVQMLPTIAFIVWLRHRAGRGAAIHLGLRHTNLPMILWGVVLVMASGVVIEPLLGLFPTEAYDNVQQTIGLGGWAILSTVVAAPILEEILFRGLIFESCAEHWGRGVGLVVSALLFGVIHIVPVQVVNAFVVGLILGYVYLRTRSLLSVIIIHAVNNAIAYATMALFGDAANVTLRDVVPSDWLYWVIYGLSALVCLWALVRLCVVLRDNTEIE